MHRALFALLVTTASVASAQFPTLVAGSRLKIDAVDRRPRLEGTLMSQSGDSLTIAAAGAVFTQLSTESIGRIQASQGKSHGAGAVKGAKIGAMILGGIGVIAGAAIANDPNIELAGGSAPILFGIVGAAEGALYGLLIGAVVGAEKWTTVYRRPVRYGFAHDGNRTSIGISIPF